MTITPTGYVGAVVLRFGNNESTDEDRRALRDSGLIRIDGGAWRFTGFGLAIWAELAGGRRVLISDYAYLGHKS